MVVRTHSWLFDRLSKQRRDWFGASIVLGFLLLTDVTPAASANHAGPALAVDVLKVRATGDSSEAVVHIPSGPEQAHHCDVVIVGAGMGGVSAALEAARRGITVCMTEPTLWVGD